MKVWNYIFISLGLITLLYFVGIEVGSASKIFELMKIGVNQTTGDLTSVNSTAGGFYDKLFKTTGGGTDWGILITLASALGAVVVGFFSNAKPENLILLPLITSTLVLFISAWLAIIQYAIATNLTWFAWLIGLIIIPFIGGFILALAEFFRGTD